MLGNAFKGAQSIQGEPASVDRLLHNGTLLETAATLL
jgi:hypothetical protein